MIFFINVSMAIGFISIFYAVGQMVGPGLAGWIIERHGFAASYGLGVLGFFINLCIGMSLKKEVSTDLKSLEHKPVEK